MEASKFLLAVFVALTIVFALISSLEFGQLSQMASTHSTSLSVQISNSTTASNPFKDNGYIQIGTIGYFNYSRVPFSGYNPITSPIKLGSTTFTYLIPNATSTGCVCYTFKVTFQGNSSESLTASSYPTNFESVIVFSKHSGPTAGLLLVPSGGTAIYVMVTV
jgi:hypothetical protein